MANSHLGFVQPVAPVGRKTHFWTKRNTGMLPGRQNYFFVCSITAWWACDQNLQKTQRRFPVSRWASPLLRGVVGAVPLFILYPFGAYSVPVEPTFSLRPWLTELLDGVCKQVRILLFGAVNPLIATLKPQSNGPSYSNTLQWLVH